MIYMEVFRGKMGSYFFPILPLKTSIKLKVSWDISYSLQGHRDLTNRIPGVVGLSRDYWHVHVIDTWYV